MLDLLLSPGKVGHAQEHGEVRELTAPGGAGATPGESARLPPSELSRLCAPVAEVAGAAGVTGAAPALAEVSDAAVVDAAALYDELDATGAAAATSEEVDVSGAAADASYVEVGRCKTPAAALKISAVSSHRHEHARKHMSLL